MAKGEEVRVYCGDWETFDDLLEQGLMERDASRSVGFFRQVFVITDGGLEAVRERPW